MSYAGHVLMVFCGMMLALAGLLAGVGYLGLPVWSPGTQTLATSTLLAAIAALGLGLGLGLVRQGAGALAGRPGRPVDLPRGVLLALIFCVVLAFGPAMLRLSQLALWVFPLFYLAAIGLPVLIVIGFVWRRTREATNRQMIVQLAYGALGATILAGCLELLAFASVTVAVLAGVSLLPGGMAWVQQLQDLLQTPAGLQDPERVRAVLLTPPILLVGGLLVLVLGPAIEEAVKSLSVLFLSSRLSTRSQAFAWGVAAGAGFALTEGLFNSILAIPAWQAAPGFPGTGGAAQMLGTGLASWDQGVLLRAGASLLHALTGGLMGLGWYGLLRQSRPWSLLGMYALSVGMHAWWNGLVLGEALNQMAAEAAGQLFAPWSGSLLWLTSLVLGVALVRLTIRRSKKTPG